MNFTKTLIAVAATVASLGANASITATTLASSGSFLTLAGDNTTHVGTLGGTVGTIAGGSFLTGDSSTADMQAFNNQVYGGVFLSSGPAATTPSVLTLTTPVSFISFVWGSPDTYNTLSITTNLGNTYSYVPGGVGGLSFTSTDGSQNYAQYVGFTAVGETITKLTFSSSQDAFETANFSVTAPVPEPETYALMLGGLGVLGFVARRRRPV